MVISPDVYALLNTRSRDLALPERCVLTAVIRKGELMIPRGDIVLQPADEVLAVVHASHLKDVADLLGRRSAG